MQLTWLNIGLLSLSTTVVVALQDPTLQSYMSHEQMTEYLHGLAITYPHILKVYTIGFTAQGFELVVARLTSNHTDESRPHVKLIGNIHGNEPVGRQILLRMVQYLCVSYHASDPQVTHLLHTTVLHLLPCLNPEGFFVAVENSCTSGPGRKNSRGRDLNRNFPDDLNPDKDREEQLETAAVRAWMDEVPFVLSASLHSGSLVVNYPFDNVPNSDWDRFHRWVSKAPGSRSMLELAQEFHESLAGSFNESLWLVAPAPSPDDDLFVTIASQYAATHPFMHLGQPCSADGTSFPKGITNGAAWYPISDQLNQTTAVRPSRIGLVELRLEGPRCDARAKVTLEHSPCLRHSPYVVSACCTHCAASRAHLDCARRGMQDYNYLRHGCMEITLELSCCKYPMANQLPSLWQDNFRPLLELVEQAQRGVKGHIKDSRTGKQIPRARVSVANRNVTFYSSSTGYYWRLLLPGRYFLKVESDDYVTQYKHVEVEEHPAGPLIVHFDLEPVKSTEQELSTEISDPEPEHTESPDNIVLPKIALVRIAVGVLAVGVVLIVAIAVACRRKTNKHKFAPVQLIVLANKS